MGVGGEQRKLFDFVGEGTKIHQYIPPLLNTNCHVMKWHVHPGSYGTTICNNGLDNVSLKVTNSQNLNWQMTNQKFWLSVEKCSEIVIDKRPNY